MIEMEEVKHNRLNDSEDSKEEDGGSEEYSFEEDSKEPLLNIDDDEKTIANSWTTKIYK